MTSTQRVLITGGAGFIGSHLVEILLGHGHSVRVLDNLSTGKRANLPATSGSLEFVLGDVTDRDAVDRCVDGVDAVVHLAAVVSVPASVADPIGTHQTNLLGTLNVLEAFRKAAARGSVAHAPRFVYASSAAVYGDVERLPVTEDTPPKPLSPYAIDKLSGEHYLRLYARQYGLSGTAFRFFNIYGPRQDPRSPYSGVISIFTDRVRQGTPVTLFGDGLQTRDFVYVKDLAAILAETLEAGSPPQGPLPWDVFNVGSGRAATLLDVLSALESITGTAIPRQFEPPRIGDIRHSLADTTRLRSAFTQRVSTPLEVGLQELLSSLAETTQA